MKNFSCHVFLTFWFRPRIWLLALLTLKIIIFIRDMVIVRGCELRICFSLLEELPIPFLLKSPPYCKPEPPSFGLLLSPPSSDYTVLQTWGLLSLPAFCSFACHITAGLHPPHFLPLFPHLLQHHWTPHFLSAARACPHDLRNPPKQT